MILVIGYGNTLRGDDGAGVRLVEDLAEQGFPDVEVQTSHQLTPEMVLWIARAKVEAVVFVDATVGEEKTTLRRVTPDLSSSVGHYLTPEVLMDYAERLYGRTPEAWLMSVPAFQLEHGESLTDACAEELARGSTLLENWIDSFCATVRLANEHSAV